MIVGDTEVLCVCPFLRFGFFIYGFLCCGSIRKCLPLTADLYGNGMVVQFFLRHIIGRILLILCLRWGRMLRFFNTKSFYDYIIGHTVFFGWIESYGLCGDIRLERIIHFGNFGQEKMRITLIMPYEIIKDFPIYGFITPAIGSGIYTDTLISYITDCSFNITVMIWNNYGITYFICGNPFQSHWFTLYRFMKESIPFLLIHCTKNR